jgi:hypothetical protein
MDVVILSEVSAHQRRPSSRVDDVLERMNRVSAWKVTLSRPSGVRAQEVHVMFYRDHLEIVRQQTLTQIGDTRMDYAPLTVLFRDSRNGGGEFVLTGVHMPPEGRRLERDVQIGKLLSAYSSEAAVRLNTPFTMKGAKDARASFVSHIIAGDWNAWVGDTRYECEKNGFLALFGQGVSTSSGKKPFDNFLISKDTMHAHTIGSRVMELQTPHNSRLSMIGVSDHSPIALELGRSI